MKRRNAIVLGSVIVIVLAFPVCAVLWFVREARRAPVTQASVEKELNEVVPPAGATVTQHNVSNKWTQGVIGNYYRSTLTYDQIRAHYDAELGRHGWKFKQKILLTNWDKDFDESQTIYCRGNHAADIYFTGNGPNRVSYRYALDISWGLDYCP